ncbi:hypothetical protein INT44_008080, partial [Umbelopsis vinacea]
RRPAYQNKHSGYRLLFVVLLFALNMPIAPIAGKLRKRLILDISVSLGLGITGGYAWWNLHHIPNVQRRDAFYAKLEANKE